MNDADYLYVMMQFPQTINNVTLNQFATFALETRVPAVKPAAPAV